MLHAAPYCPTKQRHAEAAAKDTQGWEMTKRWSREATCVVKIVQGQGKLKNLRYKTDGKHYKYCKASLKKNTPELYQAFYFDIHVPNIIGGIGFLDCFCFYIPIHVIISSWKTMNCALSRLPSSIPWL